eukprot:1138818-Pelagomonas_calceolata.AAC.14
MSNAAATQLRHLQALGALLETRTKSCIVLYISTRQWGHWLIQGTVEQPSQIVCNHANRLPNPDQFPGLMEKPNQLKSCVLPYQCQQQLNSIEAGGGSGGKRHARQAEDKKHWMMRVDEHAKDCPKQDAFTRSFRDDHACAPRRNAPAATLAAGRRLLFPLGEQLAGKQERRSCLCTGVSAGKAKACMHSTRRL